MRYTQLTENALSVATTKVTIIESDSRILFDKISTLIEQSRRVIYTHANGTTAFLYWEIGKYINAEMLRNKRADYGKQIVSALDYTINRFVYEHKRAVRQIENNQTCQKDTPSYTKDDMQKCPFCLY